ncbi:MAG: FtsX-like permease family protein [Candidatus Eisenbacteria bacterium]|nr:FtsX-like permease family protein [Candidatus Eisenbacteria bacterium]
MNVYESILSGLASIWSHKLRSALTLFGIVVGVAAVISMFSFVDGIVGRIREDFEKLGFDNTFFVSNMDPLNPDRRAELKASDGLTLGDIDALRAEVPEIRGITPVVSSYTVIRAGSEARRGPIFGVTPDGFTLFELDVGEGRSLSDIDVEEHSRVCVLGQLIKEDLFGDRSAIGETVLVRDVSLEVVGVLRMKEFSPMFGNSGQEQEHRRIYAPYTTISHYLAGTKRIDTFAVKLRKGADIASGYDRIFAVLYRRHRMIEDFQIENVAEQIAQARDQVDQISSQWRAILGSIATVSLLVGGIGLLSVLIISVNERLREIGIRKAVGAEDRAIFQQFLIESVTISVVGGLIGVALGAGLCKLITLGAAAAGQEMVIPVSGTGVLLGLGFAVAVGVLFGIYPAVRASRLDPIEAISRYA